VRDVEQQHQRFIDAIQVSPNGIIMLDDEHRIVWCNANAEQQFGLDAERDVGQHITYLIRQPEFIRYLGAPHQGVDLRMAGMGRKLHKILSVQILPYGDNRKVIISQDITKLERTDAMRRDFVANVSHELKTPLTVLAGHIEADPKPPGDKFVDIESVVRHLGQDARGLSAGKHTIHMHIDRTVAITGAESEIASAFGNLVTNAVRYTPEGGQIDVSWQIEDGYGVFSVTDNGIGVPIEHIPRLTERFYRVDRSRSRGTGGTGLGLAIVKHVLQRHEARLSIRSHVGRGSTFAAYFPKERTTVVKDEQSDKPGIRQVDRVAAFDAAQKQD
jgi:two-component system phosphate regulon sensor histidine kinase PhoR